MNEYNFTGSRIGSFKISIAVFLIWNAGLQMAAQVNLKNLETSWQYIPSSGYFISSEGTDNIDAGSSIIQHRFNTKMDFSISTKIDTASNSVKIWSASVYGDYLSMQLEGDRTTIFPSALLATNISIQHIRSLKNKWAFIAMAGVGVNSDLEKINGNDVFASVGGLFVKNYSPRFSIGFGLFVNNNFGKPLPWPAIMVNWQLGSKYRLDINVPDNGPGLAYTMSFTYQITKNTDLGIFFQPSVIAYDVENRPNNERLLTNWKIPIGLKNTWHQKHLDFNVNAGLMALRSFTYVEKDVAKVFDENVNHSLKTNLFFGLGIKYTN